MLNSNFYRILNEKLKYKIFIFKDSNEVLEALEICKYKKLQDRSFPNAYALSDFRAKRGDDLRSYSFELGELFLSLSKFYDDKNSILLAPIHSILYPLPSKDKLEPLVLKLYEHYNFLDLQEKLLNYGFEKLDLVHAPKEIAIHGDIIDIFPHNYENPIRISFFDNEIESIKYFDSISQMCFGDEIEEISIFPALFSIDSSSYDSLDNVSKNSDYDVFIKDIISLGFWFIDDPLIIKSYNSLMMPSAKNELDSLKEIEFLSDLDFDSFDKLNVCDIDDNYSDIALEINAIPKLFALHKDKKKILFGLNELLIDSLKLDNDVTIIKEPLSINIITKNEQKEFFNNFNYTPFEYNKNISIVDIFLDQVSKHSEDTAVIFEDKKFTYNELNNRSNIIAKELVNKGIKKNDIVGIMLNRSFDILCSIWGVLKTGAAYLLIDTSLPQDRIQYMLSNANSNLLITSSSIDINFDNRLMIDKLKFDIEEDNVCINVDNDSLFCVIYTSGSTGLPKGVALKRNRNH